MTQTPIPRILVAGIGNILLEDDGFGPQAIARLEAEYEFGAEVELLDLGTPTLDFVDYLVGRDVVVLLDALSCGGDPGEILTFDGKQLRGQLPGMRLSAHQPCLFETLYTAENAGIELKEILLVGVVGHSFEVGTQLGPYVTAAIPAALELVAEILKRHGVDVCRREQPLTHGAWWSREAALPTQ